MAAAKQIMALDVGEKRIGVALASSLARLATPHTTITRTDDIVKELQQLVELENVEAIVIGLPRGLNGQITAQTQAVKLFAKQLQKMINLPLYWQDEALTSVKAETELNKFKTSTKADVDKFAATYILEDFLKDSPEKVAHG